MKLFDHLLRHSPTCAHNNSSAYHSEIGHDAIRRYYWFCSRCGEKVYIQYSKGNVEGDKGSTKLPRSRDLTQRDCAVIAAIDLV